ncbi:lipid A biosynthesis lauroyl acyltransferase [Phycisphaerae bacterium RAS1]|nr:lipid A biosynthesis lauroyl acyltransferase [Phycisphaerae bacterium RAS1]
MNEAGRLSRSKRLALSISRRVLNWVRSRLGWSALWRLAVVAGTLEWLLKPAARRRVRRALRREVAGLPRAVLRRATLQHFRRTRGDKWFFLLMDRLTTEELERRVRLEGREHLEAALARGAGVYVVLSHFGFHDIGAAMLARAGFPCAGVRAKLNSAARRYMGSRLKRAAGAAAALEQLATSSFPREIYRWFKDNRVVGSAIDVPPAGDYRVDTLRIDGPAGPHEYMVGPLRIALRCGAAIVQRSIESRPKFRFLVRLEPLDCSAPTEDAAVQELLAAYAERTASFGRRHPDHVSRV